MGFPLDHSSPNNLVQQELQHGLNIPWQHFSLPGSPGLPLETGQQKYKQETCSEAFFPARGLCWDSWKNGGRAQCHLQVRAPGSPALTSAALLPLQADLLPDEPLLLLQLPGALLTQADYLRHREHSTDT